MNKVLGKDTVASNYHLLIDSDALLGLYLPNDAHYDESVKGFDLIEAEKLYVAVTNWVIAETATVLSYRTNQKVALTFLDTLKQIPIPILQVTADIEQEAWRIFRAQTTKRISVVDCTNAATMMYYNIPRIFGFDGFYEEKVGLQRLEIPA